MKKAFTLIEVMVVLSILAIIAILAYNFFGGTMKDATLSQAATQTFNNMRIFAEAVERYDEQYDPDIGGSGHHYKLVDSGFLKALPEPNCKYEYSGGGCGGMHDYLTVPGYEDYNDNTQADDVISFEDVHLDLCQAMADKYADGVIWDYQAAGGFTGYDPQQVVVFKWNTADTYCAIHYIYRLN